MRSDGRSARRPAVVEVTKTYGLIGELGAFSPGLKPGHCKTKRSRGFENPLPRTEVRAGTDQACSLLPNRVPRVRRPTPWLFENVETPVCGLKPSPTSPYTQECILGRFQRSLRGSGWRPA